MFAIHLMIIFFNCWSHMAARVAFVTDVECRGDDATRSHNFSSGVSVGRLARVELRGL